MSTPAPSMPPPWYYGPPPGSPPYVVTRPGMTDGAHTVNIVLSVVSCGWWLPVYLMWMLLAPVKVVDVHAAPGTPPEVIQAARLEALKLTPAEQAQLRTRWVTAGVIAGVAFLLFVGLCAIGEGYGSP